MSELAVSRPGYARVRWKRVAAILVTLGLAATVVKIGLKPLPLDRSPIKIQWDFTEVATPQWFSQNGDVQRSPKGLVLSPRTASPILSSGPIQLPVKGLGRVRVRLNLPQPAAGRIGLLLRSPSGAIHQHVLPFHLLRGGVFEEVIVPFAVEGAADDVITQVGLLPSVIPQTATVASIVLEPDASFFNTSMKELLSPLPGELMANRGFSFNSLSPSVVGGRSVWMMLIPIVLLAGTSARLVGSNPGFQVTIRRYAWGVIGVVWGLGFALMVYNQAVAVALDTQKYGGLSGDDAYAAIDGIPLSHDMREVAGLLSPGTSVELAGVLGDPDPAWSWLWGFWRIRATYYLLPILVRPSAPVRVHYFAGPHPSCDRVEPKKIVLHEAERFCLFRVKE